MASTTAPIFAAGIFDSFTKRHALNNAWTERIKGLEAERLQPYADLLLDHIWSELYAKKDQIYDDLLERCKTATHKNQLKVPIWSFNHVFGLQDLDWNTKEYIRQKGYHQTMKVVSHNGYSDDVLPANSLHPIMNLTDLLKQLALLFGTNFRVTMDKVTILVDDRPMLPSFTRHVVTLMLHYFPNCLPKHLAAAQTDLRIKNLNRVKRSLVFGERFELWKGLHATETSEPEYYCDEYYTYDHRCGYDSE